MPLGASRSHLDLECTRSRSPSRANAAAKACCRADCIQTMPTRERTAPMWPGRAEVRCSIWPAKLLAPRHATGLCAGLSALAPELTHASARKPGPQASRLGGCVLFVSRSLLILLRWLLRPRALGPLQRAQASEQARLETDRGRTLGASTSHCSALTCPGRGDLSTQGALARLFCVSTRAPLRPCAFEQLSGHC